MHSPAIETASGNQLQFLLVDSRCIGLAVLLSALPSLPSRCHTVSICTTCSLLPPPPPANTHLEHTTTTNTSQDVDGHRCRLPVILCGHACSGAGGGAPHLQLGRPARHAGRVRVLRVVGCVGVCGVCGLVACVEHQVLLELC